MCCTTYLPLMSVFLKLLLPAQGQSQGTWHTLTSPSYISIEPSVPEDAFSLPQEAMLASPPGPATSLLTSLAGISLSLSGYL